MDSRTTRKALTRTALAELLEPVLATTLEENGVPFTEESTRRVLRAVVGIAGRYFFHAGGSTHAALAQCIQALFIAQRDAAEAEAFAGVTQPVAEA